MGEFDCVNPFIVSFVTLLVGVILGHRFTLNREKRREHNEVVLPLKQKVLEYIDELKVSKHLCFTESEIKVLRAVISEQKYVFIKKLYHEFLCLKINHRKKNQSGYVIYSTEACIEISNKLKEINFALSLK